mmetsp:Transcript_14611/g.40005  ORF Transcript_14611/g.40005 Transcript_14611/m.40005 type:complete len:337 (+) Transcript_14611:184-1194(+)
MRTRVGWTRWSPPTAATPTATSSFRFEGITPSWICWRSPGTTRRVDARCYWRWRWKRRKPRRGWRGTSCERSCGGGSARRRTSRRWTFKPRTIPLIADLISGGVPPAPRTSTTSSSNPQAISQVALRAASCAGAASRTRGTSPASGTAAAGRGSSSPSAIDGSIGGSRSGRRGSCARRPPAPPARSPSSPAMRQRRITQRAGCRTKRCRTPLCTTVPSWDCGAPKMKSRGVEPRWPSHPTTSSPPRPRSARSTTPPSRRRPRCRRCPSRRSSGWMGDTCRAVIRRRVRVRRPGRRRRGSNPSPRKPIQISKVRSNPARRSNRSNPSPPTRRASRSE